MSADSPEVTGGAPVADLRHDAARRHAARGDLARVRGQAPHRAAARRSRGRVHRGRVARLEPEGRRVLPARARRRLDDRRRRGVRLHAARRRRGRRRPRARRAARGRDARCAPSSARRSIVHVTDVLRTTARREPPHDRGERRVPRRARQARHLRRRALLRRLARGRGVRAARRSSRRCAAAPRSSSSATRTAARCRGRSRRASAGVASSLGRPVGIHAHDDAGCARRELARRRARRRDARAGHDQRLRRALREREPRVDHPEPRAEARAARASAPARCPTLARVSRFVAETANLAFDEHAPYVGRSAFAHKGGVHVAAIRRSPRSYEHVDPALVGNRTRVVVSELSGRGNLAGQGRAVRRRDAPRRRRASVLARLKQREADGFAFEAADASVALHDAPRGGRATGRPFELVDYKVLARPARGRRGLRRRGDQGARPRRDSPHRGRGQRAR